MARFVEDTDDFSVSPPPPGMIDHGTAGEYEEAAATFTGKKAKSSNVKPPNKDKTLKSALEQVAKFIPTEILAAYITLFSAANALDIDKYSNQRRWFFGIALLVGVLGTWLYVAKMVQDKRYKWVNQWMASIAFLVWAYAYPIGLFNELKVYNSVGALFLLVIFTVVSGLIDIRPRGKTLG